MLPTDSIQIQDQLPVFSLGLGNIGIEIEKAGGRTGPRARSIVLLWNILLGIPRQTVVVQGSTGTVI